MFTGMDKRRYAQKKRAESRDETRLRILRAAMGLHEEMGLRQTTISAIAERAGVQRLTVYRHFPDETALITACSGHWLSLHPPPDPARWAAITDPLEQARTALTALYVYFQETQRMLAAVERDEAAVPAAHAAIEEMRGALLAMADGLLLARSGPPALRTTLRHAVQFATWQSLEREGLDDGEKADLVLGWLAGLQGVEDPPR